MKYRSLTICSISIYCAIAFFGDSRLNAQGDENLPPSAAEEDRSYFSLQPTFAKELSRAMAVAKPAEISPWPFGTERTTIDEDEAPNSENEKIGLEVTK